MMKAKTLMNIGFVLVVVGLLLYFLTPMQLKPESEYEVQWGTTSHPTLYPYDQWKRDVEILASIRSVGGVLRAGRSARLHVWSNQVREICGTTEVISGMARKE
ncbi:MAG: hypothetical protein ACXQTW_04620 [Candidatus Methanospirareceae archaeon]